MGEKTGGVGRTADGLRALGDPDADVGPSGRRGGGWGLTSLLALLISGVVLYLAWWLMWERSHPASPAARTVRSGPDATRLGAIADLERLGPEDPDVAIPALISALGDPSGEIRAAAATALVTVIQGVGGAGSDPAYVADAMGGLLARTRDPDPVARAAAVQALWMIALLWQGAPHLIDLDAIATAQARAADDPELEVRLAGVRGLGVVGKKIADDPPPRLLAAMEDESPRVRDAAGLGLHTFHRGIIHLLPALLRSLEAAPPDHRSTYIDLLEQVGPSGRGYPEENETHRADEAVTALIPALSSRDAEVRQLAAKILGRFGSAATAALPRLRQLAGLDPSAVREAVSQPMVREAALQAIKAIEQPGTH